MSNSQSHMKNNKNETRVKVALLIVLVCALALMYYFIDSDDINNITGFTISNKAITTTLISGEVYESDKIIFNEVHSSQKISSVKISGTYRGYGSINIYLNTSSGPLLIYEIENFNEESNNKKDIALIDNAITGYVILEENKTVNDAQSLNDAQIGINVFNETINSINDDEIIDSINESDLVVDNDVVVDVDSVVNIIDVVDADNVVDVNNADNDMIVGIVESENKDIVNKDIVQNKTELVIEIEQDLVLGEEIEEKENQNNQESQESQDNQNSQATQEIKDKDIKDIKEHEENIENKLIIENIENNENKVNINDDIKNKENKEKEVEIVFKNACLETCDFSFVSWDSIMFDFDGNITLFVQDLNIIVEPLFIQIKNISDINSSIGSFESIDYQDFFSGNIDYFDLSSSEGYTYETYGNIIKIIPIKEGIWPAKAYVVSDGRVLSSNDFNVFVSNSLLGNISGIMEINEEEILDELILNKLNETNKLVEAKNLKSYSDSIQYPFTIDDDLKNKLNSNNDYLEEELRVIIKYKKQPRKYDSISKYAFDVKENSKKVIPFNDNINAFNNGANDGTFENNNDALKNNDAHKIEYAKNSLLVKDLNAKKNINQDIEVVGMTPASLILLKDNSDIDAIYLDQEVSSLFLESSSLIELNMARDYALLNLNLSLDGEGVNVCLVDSGVNFDVVSYDVGYDLINNDSNPNDDNGHGTMVGYVLHSIAPSANLIVVKALNSSAQGFESDIISALDYCAEQNAHVISLSLGSGAYTGWCDNNILAQKVNELSSQGIIVVAASGNDGSSNIIKSPACARGAIAVGASTKQDELAEFSNYNGVVQILAPGENIETYNLYGDAQVVSGTSMSVAFVSGSATLLYQGVNGFENYNFEEKKDRIISTGDVIVEEDRNFSRLNVYNALIGNYSYDFVFTNLSVDYSNVTDLIVEGQLLRCYAGNSGNCSTLYHCQDNHAPNGDGDGACSSNETCYCVSDNTACQHNGIETASGSSECIDYLKGFQSVRWSCSDSIWTPNGCGYQPSDCVGSCQITTEANACATNSTCGNSGGAENSTVDVDAGYTCLNGAQTTSIYCETKNESCAGIGSPFSCSLTADNFYCDGLGECNYDSGTDTTSYANRGQVCAYIAGSYQFIDANLSHYAANDSQRCEMPIGDSNSWLFGDLIVDIYACNGSGGIEKESFGTIVAQDCGTGCCYEGISCVESGNYNTYNWYNFSDGDGLEEDYCISSFVMDCYNDGDCASGYSCNVTNGCELNSACIQNSDCGEGLYCDSTQTCTELSEAGMDCKHQYLYAKNYTEANGICKSGYCRDNFGNGEDGDGLCETGENCICATNSTTCWSKGVEYDDGNYSSNTCYSNGSGTTPGERLICSSGVWGGDSCGYSEYNQCDGACLEGRDVMFCSNLDNDCYDGGENIFDYLEGAGVVCFAGDEVAPNATLNCDATIDCIDNACVALTYYRGCSIGTSSCTETNKQIGASWSAFANYTIAETIYKNGTTCNMNQDLCGYSTFNACAGNGAPYSCQKQQDQLRCTGAGTCALDVGDNIINVLNGFVCSAGSEVSASATYYAFNDTQTCSSSTYTNGFGDLQVQVYGCNGNNAKGSAVGNATSQDCGTGCCYSNTSCIATGNYNLYNWYDFSAGDTSPATDFCFASVVYDCYNDNDCSAGYFCNETNTCEANLNCSTLNVAGKTYVLKQNVSSATTCFTVSADNIVLDCNGYSMTGTNVTNTYGITTNMLNTTIRNCVIDNYSTAIYFNGADNGFVSNVTGNTTASNGYGLYLYNGANGNNVSNSSFYSAISYGVQISGSNDNIFTASSFRSSSSSGIYVPSGINNIFDSVDAVAENAGYGIYLYNGYSGTRIFNSSVYSGSNHPIYTYYGSSNIIIDCNGKRILGNNSANVYGIRAGASTSYIVTNFSVHNCVIQNFTRALYLTRVINGSFINNTFISNDDKTNALVHILSSSSVDNIFYWNNFTETSAEYVSGGAGNFFNFTVDETHNEGNIWHNVVNGSIKIVGSQASVKYPSLYVGYTGSHYPYNRSNSANKVGLGVVDYAPLTYMTPCFSNDDCASSEFCNARNSCQEYCSDYFIPGDTVYFKGDVLAQTGSCINVIADNVTIDCKGYKILGNNITGTYGVISTRLNTSLRNCVVSNFSSAIYFNGADNGTIINVSGNSSFTNSYGLYLYSNANNNSVVNSSFYSSANYGIYLSGSDNNTFDNVSGKSFSSHGLSLQSGSEGNIFRSSYFGSFSSSGAHIVSGYNIFDSITAVAENTGQGIYLFNSYSGTRIFNSSIYSNSSYPIYMQYGSSNIDIDCNGKSITGNNVANIYGIQAGYSASYTITNFSLSNCVIQNFTLAMYLNKVINGSFVNNTFIPNDAKTNGLITIGASSSGNVFYWNNFTETSGVYVNGGANDFFNYTINETHNEGNVWHNVIAGDVAVTGINRSSKYPNLYIGFTGLGYPYNRSNSYNKIGVGAVDYAPLTPIEPCYSDNDCVSGFFCNDVNSCQNYCSEYRLENSLVVFDESVMANTGSCVNITASNVTVDCNGYKISGNNLTGTYGIYSSQPNTSLRNCIIDNFTIAIYLVNADNSSVVNVSGNTSFTNGYGLYSDVNSDDILILDSDFYSDRYYGLYILGKNVLFNNGLCGSRTSYGCYLGGRDNIMSSINGSSVTSYSSYVSGDNLSIYNSSFEAVSGFGGYFSGSEHYIFNSSFNSNGSNYGAYIRSVNSTFRRVIGSTLSGVAIYFSPAYTTSNVIFDCEGESIVGKGSGYGIQLGAYSPSTPNVNLTIKNCVISNFSNADLYLYRSINSTFINNTFIPNDAKSSILVTGVSSYSYGNVFYWNNFTDTSGLYVNGLNNDSFNFTINETHNEGNIWHNVMNGSINVAGNLQSIGHPSLYIASAGSGYPYNSSNSQNKVSAGIVDYAPLTTENICYVDTDCNDGYFCNDLGSCQNYCSSYFISNSVVNLRNNISSTNSCINVTANNITVNCNGYYIVGENLTGTYGLYSNKNYTSIKNCNIANHAYEIYLVGADNSSINNVSANTTFSSGFALWVTVGTDNITVANSSFYATSTAVVSDSSDQNYYNNIIAESQNGLGLYLSLSDSNYVFNATLRSITTSTLSISNSLDNKIENSEINGSGNGYGVNLFNAHRTNLIGNSVKPGNNHAINFNGASTNVTIDCQGKKIIGNNVINMYGVNAYMPSSYMYNVSVKNCIIQNFTHAVLFMVGNGSLINNTFIPDDAKTNVLVNIQRGSGNVIYWNNFTETSGMYVNDYVGGNFYNYTINSTHNEGNIWHNVLNGSVNVAGNSPSVGHPSLYVASTGSGFPYNYSTSLNKVTTNVFDYAPLTTENICYVDTDCSDGYFCNDLGSCQDYCSSYFIENSVVNLRSNISSTSSCINITANNVTVDCNGYSIIGSNLTGSYGIYLSKLKASIKNCIIDNYSNPIYIQGNYSIIDNTTLNTTFLNTYALHFGSYSNNNNISNSRLYSDTGYGAYIYYSDNNSFSNTTLRSRTTYAGYVGYSNYNTIFNSNASSQLSGGFYVINSRENLFEGVEASSEAANSYGFYIRSGSHGTRLIDSVGISQNVPIYIYYASHNLTIDCNGRSMVGVNGANTYGIFTDINSASLSNFTVKNCIVQNYTYGMYLWISNSNIINNTFIANDAKTNILLHLNTGSNNTIYWNNFTETSGLYVQDNSGGNFYNYTINSTHNEGNIWHNVLNDSVDIIGSNISSGHTNLYIGSSGLGYPYNSSNAFGKVTANVIDYAPLTADAPCNDNDECNDGFFCNGWNSCQSYCSTYVVPNDVVTFKGNVSAQSGSCINVTVNNVTIDCGGYSITGANLTNTYGIAVNGNSTTLRNCIINEFQHGIYLNDANNNRVSNSSIRITFNNGYGLYVYNNSNNNNIENSSIYSYSGHSIYLSGSFNNFSNVSFESRGGIGFYSVAGSNNRVVDSSAISIAHHGGYLSGWHNGSITNSNFSSSAAGNYFGLFLSGDNNNFTQISASNAGVALGLGSGSDGNRFEFAILNSSANGGITLVSSDNNYFSNIISSGNTSYGVSIDENCDNNSFYDSSFSAILSGGLNVDGSFNYFERVNGTSYSNGNGVRFDYEASNIELIDVVATSVAGTAILVYGRNQNITIDCNGKAIIGSNSATTYGIQVGYSSYNVTNISVSNCFIQNFTNALYLSGSVNGTYFNNTLIANDAATNVLVSLGTYSSGNIFYSNNFTNTSGLYVSDTTGGNYFNYTINGKNEGNVWYNIINESVNIVGNENSSIYNNLYIGISGLGYPYNSTTSLNKVSATVVDYAPLTNVAPCEDNEDCDSGYYCNALNSCQAYCSTYNLPNSTITFKEDIISSSGSCITVTANNVTIDCRGYSITGNNASNSRGIYTNRNSTAIQNCNINNFENPIYLWAADFSVISNVTANSTYNGGETLYFYIGSDENKVNNSTFYSYTGEAMYIRGSTNNIFSNIIATSYSGSGIYLYNEANNNSIFNSSFNTTTNYAIDTYVANDNLFSNITASSNTNNALRITTSSHRNRVEGLNAYSGTTTSSSAGVYVGSNSHNTSIDCMGGSVIGNGTAYGVHVLPDGVNVSNCIISNFTHALNIDGGTNGVYKNNTLFPAYYMNTVLVNIGASSIGNIFYWNNFTHTNANYIQGNINNHLNYTINSTHNEGNIWHNVMNGSVNVVGNINSSGHPNLLIANSGSNYPYNSSNSGNKIAVGFVDYAPLTNVAPCFENDDCESGFFCNQLNSCQEYCSVHSIPNSIIVLDENITSNATCININADNITVNCNGYSIIGENVSSLYGIVSTKLYTNISNCIIENFTQGVYFSSADFSSIDNSIINITYAFGSGVTFASGANNNAIRNSKIYSHYVGLQLTGWEEIVNNVTVVSNTNNAIYVGGINNSISNSDFIANNAIAISVSGSDNNFTNVNSTVLSGTINTYGIDVRAGRTLLKSVNVKTNSSSLIYSYIGYNNTLDCEGGTIAGNSQASCLDFESIGWTVKNCIIRNCSYALELSSYADDGLYVNNTFMGLDNMTGTLVYILSGAENNIFYWNNFTNTSGVYVVGTVSETNSFNFTINGRNEGNIWHNVLNGSSNIVGSVNSSGYPNLLVGETGSNYPYNSSNSYGKVTAGVVDYAPLTNLAPCLEDVDCGDGNFCNDLNSCQSYCSSYDIANSVVELRADVYSNTTCAIINANNVILDCKGYSIIGNNSINSYGIYSTKVNATLRNCEILDYYYGIYFNGADNSTISNVTVIGSSTNSRGLSLDNNANSNKVEQSVFNASAYGIIILSGDNNTINNSFGQGSIQGLITDSSSDYNYVLNSNFYSSSNAVLISGLNNILERVNATGRSGAGITISGDGTRVLGCNAYSNSSNAYYVYDYPVYNVTIDCMGNRVTGTYAINAYGIQLGYSSYAAINTTVQNCIFENFTNAMYLYYSVNGTFVNNTLIANDARTSSLMSIGSSSSGNILYWNNFTNTSSYYVSDSGANNSYNFTINGRNEGNIWHNVLNGSSNIVGSVNSSGYSNLLVGETGSNYPYNSSNSYGKVTAGVVDYAPLTNLAPCLEDVDCGDGNFCNDLNSCQSYCSSYDIANSVVELRADVYSNTTCAIINANNVILDCKGYSIIGNNQSNSYGVYSWKNNVTLRNCEIQNFTHAIYLNGADNFNIYNVSGNSTYPNSYGLYLYNNANNNAVVNSTFYSSASNAITITNSDSNIFDNISAVAIAGSGITLDSGADYNLIKNSSVRGSYGIIVSSSYFNNFTNNSAIGVNSNGVYLWYASNAKFENCDVESYTSDGYLIRYGENISIDCMGKSIIGKNIGSGVYAGSSSYTTTNISLRNCIISNFTYALNLGNSINGTFINNTLIPNDAKNSNLLYIYSSSSGNVFYWNNFTDTSGSYVSDSNGNNQFNSSLSGFNEGNIWHNVLNGSSNIVGSVNSSSFSNLLIGETGSNYPYNISNSQNKVSAGVVDYAPLTNLAPCLEDVDCSDGEFCNALHSCQSYCGSYETPNVVVVFRSNISSLGTCLNILADNVTVDCQGFSITGNNVSSTYGVYSGKFNTTIKNCVISNYSSAIRFNNALNSAVVNVSASTNMAPYAYGSYHALHLVGGSGNSFVNSSFYSYYDYYGSYAIYVYASDDNLFSGVTSEAITSRALEVDYGSDRNIFSNSNFSSTLGISVIIDDSDDNLFVDVDSNSDSYYGFYVVSGSSGTNFTRAIGYSNSNYPFYIYDGSSNTFIDCQGRRILGNNSANAYGIRIGSSSSQVYNATVKNCIIQNFTYAVNFNVVNGSFINNTLIPNDARTNTLLSIGSSSSGNILYWNNFTETSGSYVMDSGTNNSYNFTINGQNEGNIWFNLFNESMNISGTANSLGYPDLFVGKTGSNYPYNRSNSGNKVTANVIDYAPLTSLETPPSPPFVSWWNTSAISDGSSNETSISLPLISNGNYNFTVYWGDGSYDLITSWNQLETNHTYDSQGVYNINISGTIIGWAFNNSKDKLKILNITQWGDLQLGNSTSYFYGASNLQIFTQDALNLSSTTNLDSAFRDCYNITQIPAITSWDTGLCTSMNYFLSNVSNFDQNLGNLNVSMVNNLSYMLEGATLSVSNYNSLLLGWASQNVQHDVVFHAGNSIYGQDAVNARSILIEEYNWTIFDGGISEESTCRELNISNNVYRLFNNVNSSTTCMNITAPNITLNCDGFKIIGNNSQNSYGVFSNQFNTTIKNCELINFSDGIYYSNSQDGLLLNNKIISNYNSGNGIRVVGTSHRLNITNLNITSEGSMGVNILGGINVSVDCRGGSLLGGSDANMYGVYSNQYGTQVKNCRIINYDTGVLFVATNYGKIENVNTSTNVNNYGGVGRSSGIALKDASDYIIVNNVNANSTAGWGLYVYTGADYTNVSNSSFMSTASSGAGGCIINSGFNEFRNVLCEDSNFYGLRLYASHNNYFENLTTRGSSSTYGALSYYASENNMMKNSFIDGATYGARLSGANTNNTFVNNTFDASSTQVYIEALGNNNLFYWNNFTQTSGQYVQDLGLNNYNFTINSSHNEGNIWFNVINGEVMISGTEFSSAFPQLYLGNNGTSYPYSNESSDGKIIGAVVDYAPLTYVLSQNNVSPVINSSRILPEQAYYNSTLMGYCSADDEDSETIYFQYKWYVDDVEVESGISSGFEQGVEINVDNLSSSNPSRGEEWILSCRAHDTFSYSDWINSTPLIISNVPPEIVILDYPENGDEHVINLTPKFNWTGYDVDEDVLNFTLVVSTYYTFDDEIINATNITTNYFISPLELEFATYYWKVRAFDGEEYGEWSEIWNFTIEPYVSVDLIVSNMSFNSMYPGEQESTEDDAPLPFKFRNSGNVYANMYLANVTDELWSSVPLNTSYYEMRVRESGDGSFNESGSKISWFNVTNVSNVIDNLNYSSVNNNVSVDVRITAPTYEPTGVKNSSITFYWGDYNS